MQKGLYVERKRKKMDIKGRIESISDASEGANIWLRDSYLGYRSGMWEAMEKQQEDNSVTDICILFTRYIRKNNKDYTTPILATNVIGGYKTTPLGEEVAKILVNAEMEHCEIVQYSINANQVGKEKANNRLSLVIYAHFNELQTKQEVICLVGDELEERAMKPINDLLKGHNVYMGMSNYNDRDVLWNRKDLEELLISGSEGCRFMKGHFYE